MRDSVMWFLVTSVVISALFVVNARHQHRIAYLSFQAEESRRDALNDQWGQLLIEENLWAFPHRIERDATKLLSMRAPVKGDVEFVGYVTVKPELEQSKTKKTASTKVIDGKRNANVVALGARN